MEHKKSFSILKWIIFPFLVLGFGTGILYVSVQIFQWNGSYPSLVLLLGCFAISLIFVLHTSNHQNRNAKAAAFIFEAGGVVALGVTMICSIVVLREYSGSMQTIQKQSSVELDQAKEKTKQIESIGQLKSRSAQSTLAKDVVGKTIVESPKNELTIASVYARAESLLFWPLVFESGWYLIGLMVVFGIVIFAEYSNVAIELNALQQGNRQVYQTLRQNQAPLRTRNTSTPPRRFDNPNNPVECITLNWQASGWRAYNAASAYIGHISHRKFDRANPQTYDEVKGLL